MTLLVFGHKNPDTDSICSSISLTYLKNQLGENAIACALGEPRKEAQFALNYFNVEAPKILDNVKIQVKDLSYDKVNPLTPSASVIEAYSLMSDKGVKTLPIVSEDGKFEGIVTMQEIAKDLLHQHFNTIHTSISNICKNLNGSVLVNCDEEVTGRVVTLSFNMDAVMDVLSEGDIAIVGNLSLIHI